MGGEGGWGPSRQLPRADSALSSRAMLSEMGAPASLDERATVYFYTRYVRSKVVIFVSDRNARCDSAMILTGLLHKPAVGLHWGPGRSRSARERDAAFASWPVIACAAAQTSSSSTKCSVSIVPG